MEVYAKVLLYEVRLKHQQERLPLLQSNDIGNYVKLVYQQIEPELKSFIEAQEKVTQLAKIDYNIYYASQQEYTVGKQGVYDTVVLSMASPFKSQRGFTKDKAREMFIQCSD